MTKRFDDAQRTLNVSVNDLVDAGWSDGNLRAGPAAGHRSRKAWGQAAHADWQASRESEEGGFRREVWVQRQVSLGEWTAVIGGRIDGWSEENGRPLIEELKSTVLPAERLLSTAVADWPVHVAQLRLYLWVVHDPQRELPYGRLVLQSMVDGSRHSLGVDPDLGVIEGRVRDILEHWLLEHQRVQAWLADRRTLVLPVPFDPWRPGQLEVAQAVEQALDNGNPALIEAPTGFGKTAAVMYGVLRYAFREGKRVFWATSRNTQQPAVLAAVAQLASRGLPLRAVRVGAKERYCLHSAVRCDPEECMFARDYFEKVRKGDIVERAIQSNCSDAAEFRNLGRGEGVCPHELSLEVSERVDLVVGDYNYVFDPEVFLRRHFGENAGDWVVVVDEAHQLAERARGYLTAVLSEAAVVQAAEAIEGKLGAESFIDGISEFRRVWERALAVLEEPLEEASVSLVASEWTELADEIEAQFLNFGTQYPEAGWDHPWWAWARAVIRFAEGLSLDDGRPVLARRSKGERSLTLLGLDPAPLLNERSRGLAGWIGVSATLMPIDFHRRRLGLADSAQVYRARSFFDPKRRKVLVVPRISTAYRDRAREAEPTARMIERIADASLGNLLIYFPSFEMLTDIVERCVTPGHRWVRQQPTMDEASRVSLLGELNLAGKPVILAAVIGGVFAEGIDLPPGAVGAVIVCGPALPPVGLPQRCMEQHLASDFGDGFYFGSVVPGLTKVIQAAGRLIRRSEDRGVVVLLDRRFRWRGYLDLLPAEWLVEIPDDPVVAIQDFWSSV